MSIQRKYNNRQLNDAGNILKKPENFSVERILFALDALTYWRTIHAAPINTFQSTLRDKIYTLKLKNVLIAQRLKRAPSIISKLDRFENMNLARMQDIAGLRAVLKNVSDVRKLEENYLDSKFKHILINHKDYINEPAESGYRGIHLIYQYNNSKVIESDGLRIELQIRTKLQHVWATAVETMGTFLNYSLKSSQGPKQWLDFFSLVSVGFSIIENCPKPPGYSDISDADIFKMIIAEADNLDVDQKLKAFTIAADHIVQSKSKSKYNLIILDLTNKRVSVETFSNKQLEEANIQYTKIEKDIADGANLQVVLVSTGSIDSLKKAYPSYFLDTEEFLNKLNTIRRGGRLMFKQLELDL